MQTSKTLTIIAAQLVPIIRTLATRYSPTLLLTDLLLSFVPQTVDGIEVRCEIRWIVSEEQSHTDGDREPDRHPKIRERRWNRRHKRAHHRGDARPDEDANGPAYQRERHCFQQELQPYVRAPRSDGFSYADLLRPFGYGNQHDVHHADAAHQQTNRANHRG